MYACTVARPNAPSPGSVRYRGRMDYFERKVADVQTALASDPELARALRRRALGSDRWGIVIEDWSRERLRESLADSGWERDELDSVPMLNARGREVLPMPPPPGG